MEEFPQFPGEEFFAHAGSQWVEMAEVRLTKRGLLAVAQGHDPPTVTSIVDIDLTELPELPQSHRDHHRRLEARTKIRTQNVANEEIFCNSY